MNVVLLHGLRRGRQVHGGRVGRGRCGGQGGRRLLTANPATVVVMVVRGDGCSSCYGRGPHVLQLFLLLLLLLLLLQVFEDGQSVALAVLVGVEGGRVLEDGGAQVRVRQAVEKDVVLVVALLLLLLAGRWRRLLRGNGGVVAAAAVVAVAAAPVAMVPVVSVAPVAMTGVTVTAFVS